MDGAGAKCPACGAGLVPNYAGGVRRYDCRGCGSLVIGIGAFRQVLAPGVAQRLWTADPPAQPTADPARCPFCGAGMQERSVETGRLAVCKPCEVIWADKQALAVLPAAVTPRLGPISAGQVPHCSRCGAPLNATWDERCRYCGSVVRASSNVLVVPGPRRHRYADRIGLPGRVLGWVIDGVVRAISIRP